VSEQPGEVRAEPPQPATQETGEGATLRLETSAAETEQAAHEASAALAASLAVSEASEAKQSAEVAGAVATNAEHVAAAANEESVSRDLTLAEQIAELKEEHARHAAWIYAREAEKAAAETTSQEAEEVSVEDGIGSGGKPAGDTGTSGGDSTGRSGSGGPAGNSGSDERKLAKSSVRGFRRGRR
jgi:membrane protein involved in colicin uptake